MRELPFHLDGRQMRVTYWIATGRRIILLTVFSKSRQREVSEVQRASRALATCMAEAHVVKGEGDD